MFIFREKKVKRKKGKGVLLLFFIFLSRRATRQTSSPIHCVGEPNEILKRLFTIHLFLVG